MYGAELVLLTVLTATSQSPHCVPPCDVMAPKHLGNPGVCVRVCLDEAAHGRTACPACLGQLGVG